MNPLHDGRPSADQNSAGARFGGLPAAVSDKARALVLVAFDFDGVFTDNRVLIDQDGREAVSCWRGDGIGLRAVERSGLATICISTEINPVVSARCRKLALRCIQACEDKRAAVEQLAHEYDCDLDAVAFVGNDVNDRVALEVVGLPIVVADAHPDVLPLARYRTVTCGGWGAVREVCDLLVWCRTETAV